ncbi:hypothetical protein BO70DRAFT_121355 [Aspergillus heteromorphus CBS 117.55]|uniref:Uncharacterized protein n=1 Tax=Aspergillus heteromorphus CBS 117.55 TaxID=1448321 RepID=A0A317VE52_9EURO|nr:uncharacterized protein BO70DRAFT_121355 [Aspergillus heteromorphus CBS 117.55]PWY71709.1 hypothetical protein BO70DRAFT_121355 [Aspergillus heteromorphus CBS 117.55]
MPHLVHHRRRHSWPYCGPGTQLRERRHLAVIALEQQQQQFLTPVGSEDLLEDDAASAGIVRSKVGRSHRRWFAPKTGGAGAVGQMQVPTTTTGTGAGTGSSGPLRRMIRPPLDKARSLFVLPTTTTTGQNVLVSYWVPQDAAAPVPPVAVPVVGGGGRAPEYGYGPAAAHLLAERFHRRCHSEQPRSWKRPSATLWPLEEE